MTSSMLGELFLEIVDSLNESMRKLKQQIFTDEDLSKMSINQLYYLKAIHELGSPTYSAIADKLNVSKPSVTTLVRKLIEQGYVAKSQSQEDKRIFYLSLSEKGSRIIELEEQVFQDFIKHITESLKDEEIEQLTILLKKINIKLPRS